MLIGFKTLRQQLRPLWSSGISFVREMIASDFIHKVAETFMTKIILMGIGIIIGVMVARILGPEKLGTYAMATAIGAMGIQFGNLGLHASNIFYAAKDQKLVPELVGNTLTVSFVLGGTTVVVLTVIFSAWPHLAPVHGLLLILALSWIPFGLAFLLMQNILLGVQKVRDYNKIDLATNILNTVLIALILIIGAVSVELLVSLGLGILIVSLVWSLQVIRPLLYKIPRPSFSLFKDSIRYGIKAHMSALLAFLVFRVDLFMVNYFLGSKDAGLYSVSANMANMISIFPVIVGSLFFPKICVLSDWNEKLKLVKKTSAGMVFVMVPTIASALLIVDFAINTFYGITYAASASSFKWLMPGVLILSVESIARRFLISDKYRIEVVYIWIATFFTNMLLNYLLIPSMGINGAAIASSLSFLFLAVLTAFLMMKFVVQIRLSGLAR